MMDFNLMLNSFRRHLEGAFTSVKSHCGASFSLKVELPYIIMNLVWYNNSACRYQPAVTNLILNKHNPSLAANYQPAVTNLILMVLVTSWHSCANIGSQLCSLKLICSKVVFWHSSFRGSFLLPWRLRARNDGVSNSILRVSTTILVANCGH
ncbi:hypothetical protein ACFE04_012828 [Oxalis oulophora]